MENGFVAFIDILGFSRRVASEGLEGFFPEYEGALREALIDREDKRMSYVVSSDSVVIYNKEDNAHGLMQLIDSCGRLYSELLEVGLAIRGCISAGKFIHSTSQQGTIVAGPALLEAIDYEKLQDWVGIMLGPSVMRRFPHIEVTGNVRVTEVGRWFQGPHDADAGQHIIARASIPFQGQVRAYDGWAVLPGVSMIVSPNGRLLHIDAKMRELRLLRSLAPDPRSQAKYDHALVFLQAARDWLGGWEQNNTGDRKSRPAPPPGT